MLVWLVAMVILVALSHPAGAVQLTNWNVTELNSSGDYVNVVIGTDNGNTTVSVQWVAGPENLLNAIGLDMFGMNTNTSVLTCPSGWSCNEGAQVMDGFGSFLQFEKDPGGTDGISNPILFVLNGLATFSPNNHSATFAAHVRYENSCSGFVSDGTTTSRESDPNCGVQVPEPASLILLGSGLLVLGFWRKLYSSGK